MSLVISGDAANVTAPLASTVVGMANNGSGAIRVQTSAPHRYATGNYVHVDAGAVDAYFVIEVIDTTHFDLVGSTYTATGTGTATDVSLTPQIQVPTDGDTGSLQLSGMLSALQALADRTQALAKSGLEQSAVIAFVSASATIVAPPWSTHMLLLGYGGGGAGGGGPGGIRSSTDQQYSAGGGGAGAAFGYAFVPLFGATRLDVTIGSGGVGGLGGNGGLVPTSGDSGTGGGTTTVEYVNGAFPGVTAARFTGGAAGGRGTVDIFAYALGSPTPPSVFTSGGKGPGAGFSRSPVSARESRYSPSSQQFVNVIADSGTGVLSLLPTEQWPEWVYTDPIGQMTFGEGGASMAVAGVAGRAAGLSYDGMRSENGFAGGAAGTVGAVGGSYPGGAAGGGGGGGPNGAGGAGGNGGASSAAGTPGAGTAGAAGSGGSGGGGGGGGGQGGADAGNGAPGGDGGDGGLYIVFLAG